MLKRIIFITQVLCLLLILCSIANAGTIVFDNFGTGDTYNKDGGWTVSNETAAGSQTVGNAFTPSVTGFVSDIWLAVSLSFGSNSLNVALMSDLSGQPGSILESWFFSDDMGPFGTLNPPLYASGNGTTELLSGNMYWLVASAPQTGTSAAWNRNSVNDFGPIAGMNGGPWTIDYNERGTFRVALNPIPEPSTVFLVGTGLAGVLLLRKRFKKQI